MGVIREDEYCDRDSCGLRSEHQHYVEYDPIAEKVALAQERIDRKARQAKQRLHDEFFCTPELCEHFSRHEIDRRNRAFLNHYLQAMVDNVFDAKPYLAVRKNETFIPISRELDDD